ncbi:hypothetical protein ANCDUO_03312 [Ancylostoma duodenale]|uniref:Uncharacterized protein n=1 Tax=Ancylostoma duodenale TaxID=51022 RepID=A0A0C2D9F7_9BILA|nr:hypothetical protein ANCDUO_03312 [Ancylostoma duodenale]
MGLETSDEGSATEGNDDDAARAEDEVRDGDPEDEDSLRGALRGNFPAFRRRRWRMIRNSERRATGSTVESLPSASQAEDNEREDVGPSSDEDESEGPRKRVKRDTDSSDSSDDEFAVCESGIPIDVWPIRKSRSPTSS